ncbi:MULTISPECIES: amidohydrolase/deacetylase family metallohydrolase [Pseudofrankia]|uniref:amidohydrolase/deacetylase family metallohydrolase n=1 Tax=Pseudofrankia TaxID=2994363 RepID=UPI000234BEAD|nr:MULTISPECIES: amidohydrolase/deacetylase family metallohydrolase [Pseudofrankia]OHV42003.1 dihydroorotase [Pseudofrankia sp. EUN1h]
MRDPNSGDAASVTVLAGGRVIDPANGIDMIADVVCAHGRIVAVGPAAGAAHTTPPAEAPAGGASAEVIDCAGLVVTPGLIDLHVHVYPGLGDFCVHPDRAGVEVGVPVVVDGGTSGVRTLGISRAFAQGPGVRTRVLAFMDPCLLYLATKDFIAHRLEIANDPRNLDLDAAAATIEEHRDYVVGFKVRATTTEDARVSPFLEGAKSIAGDLPIMIHLGKYPYTKSLTNLDALAALRPGDIVTHAFRGHSGALVNDGTAVHPVFADAVARGVRLDVGHSGSDFRFAAARALLDLGYPPHTVSTDLNLFNEDGPVYSLPETMSKIWSLGASLADVIAMATVNPAASIRRSAELGTLDVGRPAEVSVLRVEEGPAAFSDGFETIAGERRLAPVGCVRGGTWIEATGPLHAERGATGKGAGGRAGDQGTAANVLPRRQAGVAAASAAAESLTYQKTSR